jgi:hypothetical protein
MAMTHETEQDLYLERRIAERLAQAWKCKPEKLPAYWHCDYLLTRQSPDYERPIGAAWCELRGRTCNRYDYPTIFVDVLKSASLAELSDFSGIPCLFVVQWQDEAAYIDMSKAKGLAVSYPRRNNPRVGSNGKLNTDAPVINLPTDAFITLWEGHV